MMAAPFPGGKYVALEQFLRAQQAENVEMTFAEIERIIGAKLPRSAYKYRAWWSNNPASSVITHAWLRAGFRTEQVDMKARRLVFRRVVPVGRAAAAGDLVAVREAAAAFESGAGHPLIGALKGTITIAKGTDLTEPADPDWGRAGR